LCSGTDGRFQNGMSWFSSSTRVCPALFLSLSAFQTNCAERGAGEAKAKWLRPKKTEYKNKPPSTN
jgi:hypothetical protein